MCEILAFLAEMVKSGLEKYFWNPPYAYRVIFITEFVLLIKIPPFYEANSFDRKWMNFKNIFLDHFSPSFLG